MDTQAIYTTKNESTIGCNNMSINVGIKGQKKQRTSGLVLGPFSLSQNAEFAELHGALPSEPLPRLCSGKKGPYRSPDPQLCLVRPLLSGRFRKASGVARHPPKFSNKSFSAGQKTVSHRALHHFYSRRRLVAPWLLVWTGKTSLPQDLGSWTNT